MVHTAPKNAKHKCPRCDSGDVDKMDDSGLICLDCGYDESVDK